jgi:hypothetical protein
VGFGAVLTIKLATSFLTKGDGYTVRGWGPAPWPLPGTALHLASFIERGLAGEPKVADLASMALGPRCTDRRVKSRGGLPGHSGASSR